MRWWDVDPGRLLREQQSLGRPWSFAERDDGRMGWSRGQIGGRAGLPRRDVELIYPEGFPARFIEARLVPDLSVALWAAAGAHVNADGSACYIAGEAWQPRFTAQDALRRLETWWHNFHWLIEQQVAPCWEWPAHGRWRLSSSRHAVVRVA